MLVLFIGNAVALDALMSALGGLGAALAGGSFAGGGVVSAGGDLVRSAADPRVVEAAGDESPSLPVLPGALGEATIAAHAAVHTTAGEKVIRGDLRRVGRVGVDADPVGHGLRRSKGLKPGSSWLIINSSTNRLPEAEIGDYPCK